MNLRARAGVTTTTVPNEGTCLWQIAPRTPLGVHQKLGTHAGGEVISSDQY
jgi:hypothetical protein